MADDAMISLNTLIERPRIAIDGQFYEIMSSEELPLLTSQRLAAKGRELDRLMKLDELLPEQAQRLPDLLGELCAIIMDPVPAEVRATLSDAQKQSVIEVFTMLSLARKTRLAGAMMTGAAGKKPKTGANSSPASSGSTAAPQAIG